LPAVTGAVRRDHALELGQRLQAGLARVLVLRHDDRIALLLRGCVTGHDLGVEEAASVCAATALSWLASAHADPALRARC
jgi:hypothetical protein